MYGIRGMVAMASTAQDRRWTLPEIAKETNAPEAFMGKIMQQLVKARLVSSVKGHGGGFALAASSRKRLTLADVVRVIDGDALFQGCALGFDKCDDRRPCPIHVQMIAIRHHLSVGLSRTRIEALGEQLAQGELFMRTKR
jgi:Rrf2 family protein